MRLPSEELKEQMSDTPYSTVRSRVESWYEDMFIKRLDKPIETYNGKILEIGKIYTFAYDPIWKDKMDFYSFMPINIIMGHYITKAGHLNAMGLNLSFVPPEIRIKILDRIVKIFKSTVIDGNVYKIDNENFNLKHLPLTYDIAKRILDGSGFEFAIRSYRYDHIGSEPRIITYEDWWKLSLYTIPFIAKMNIRAIYFLYHKNLTDEYQIGKKSERPRGELTPAKVTEVLSYLKEKRKGIQK